jgi:hypothetical protein
MSHHGARPVPTTTLRVIVEDVRGRGVQVRLVEDRRGDLFWLPRGWPADWSVAPTVGEVVAVKLPRWMAQQHKPVVGLRCGYQSSLSPYLNPLPGLDPAKAEGTLPMATDYPEDIGKGALFKNRKKEKPSHPDYRGECEIDGRKLRISAWLRKSEKTGETYMSLAFREAEEQQQPKPQQPAGGPTFGDEPIPF